MYTISRLVRAFFRSRLYIWRGSQNGHVRSFADRLPQPFASLLGGFATLYSVNKYCLTPAVVKQTPPTTPDKEPKSKLTAREKRFIRFASVEYDGQLYMTPQDFLESIVAPDPRPRFQRNTLQKDEIEKFKYCTPSLKQSSSKLFRTLRKNGIISFTEYLFLISVLTKPESGFKIAFNMFDTDGNQIVDKQEFLELERILSCVWKNKRNRMEEQEPVQKPQKLDDYMDEENGLQKQHFVDTTLILHFFGSTSEKLNFESFRQFMINLQTEILELEFNEFAKGLLVISEVDFAKILLRYTYLDTTQYDLYLERLHKRVSSNPKGITFAEFFDFCQFLNNLEDFAITIKMYTLADRPISPEEFQRAVKICTGRNLSNHIIKTVFAIFDEDGDGSLSYLEFIAIMKNRLQRGSKVSAKKPFWENFKSCMKQELRQV